MNAAYFPFTFLNPATTADWIDCFSGLRVYCPLDGASCADMAETARQKGLDLRAPCPENSAQVLDMCRSHKQWKEAHTGVDSYFYRQTAHTVPFFDETTISRLKQDITDAVSRKPRTAEPLLMAQLFLQLTHEHDREQIMLTGSLTSLADREKEMLTALQGDDSEPLPSDRGNLQKAMNDINYRDMGAYLTAERIRAWSLLAARDSATPSLLVTDSRAVFDHIQEMMPRAAVVLEDLPEPVEAADKKTTRDGLHRFLDRLTAGDRDASPPQPATGLSATPFFWNVMVLPDANLSDFISFFSENNQADGPDSTPQASPASVVIVGVDRCRRKLA